MENKEVDISDFDRELTEYINNFSNENHVFNLGKPGEILQKCGFPEHQRIELSSSRLQQKSTQSNHPFEFADIIGLDKAIQKPVAVFEYGDKNKSQNVIVNLKKDGKNFLVGVFFNQNRDGFEVTSVRGLFNRDNIDWLRWIDQGKMIYGNIKEIQVLAAQQRTNLADVDSKEARTSSDSYYLDSVDNILAEFGNVNDIFTADFPEYARYKERAEIFKQFRNKYQENDSFYTYMAKPQSDEFYAALKERNLETLLKYTKFDSEYEISGVARKILFEKFDIEPVENNETLADVLKSKFNVVEEFNNSNKLTLQSSGVNNGGIESENQNEIEEKDAKKTLPAFALLTESGIEILNGFFYTDNHEHDSVTISDGKISFPLDKKIIDEIKSGEKTQGNSDRLSKRGDQPSDLLLQSQYDDFFSERDNKSYNFRHNFAVRCRKNANSPADAIEIAKNLIKEMDVEDRKKTKELLKHLNTGGKSYNEYLVDMYLTAVKNDPLNEDWVRNNHQDRLFQRKQYDTVNLPGEKISSRLDIRIGDNAGDIGLRMEKIFGFGFVKEKMNLSDFCIKAASKEDNSITLMGKDHSILEIPRDEYIEAYQRKHEKIQKNEKKASREKERSMEFEISR